jgi:predicted Kef-type K+ transport protein
MENVTVLAAFPFSLAVAFLLGFGARVIGLPPLVGFLVAGFILNAAGVRADDTIREIADFGVLLLLFTIGLKLKIKSLMRPEVFAGATLHTAITIAVFGGLFYGLAAAGISIFADLSIETAFLIAFAMSFSSTVFAVKVLENKGEMPALHGRTAIGILIMQDIFAVLFLTISLGKVPSLWAFALFGLYFIRPVLGYLIDRVGHGELLPLLGLFAAVALGAATFELVGLKPDLGALILGMLMASHKRAGDIAESLFSFKEIFLVAFFLNIGLGGVPSFEDIAIAACLVLLIPLKTALFFFLLTRFNLRARSSLLSAFTLSNYSEFGLIVAGIGVSTGWIDAQWLIIIAIALSISFVIASPLNTVSHGIYARLSTRLARFETERLHPEDQPPEIGDARIVVFGMGRIGTGAFDYIRENIGGAIVGVDVDMEKVAAHHDAGRTVIHGDATDSDFWRRVRRGQGQVEVILLAMPEHHANMFAIEQIVASDYKGFVAAIAVNPHHAAHLTDAGADVAFNAHNEAGTGFAIHVEDELREATGRA